MYGKTIQLSKKGKSANPTPPEDPLQKLATQCQLFRQYSSENHLNTMHASEFHWFESGGNRIARLPIEGDKGEDAGKWRQIGEYQKEFPCHFT